VGRPGVAAYFRDLQKVTMKVVSLGGDFASYNPVVALMDKSTGALKEEVLNEKVLSAIAEFIVPREKALDVLEKLLTFINAELESVATISVISRNDETGGHSFLRALEAHGKLYGYAVYPNGKVNIGIAALNGGNP
jgi:hypothetical protein